MKAIMHLMALSILFAISLAEGPIDLDMDSFYEKVMDKESNSVKTDQPWFIKFYAPWCGHCQRLAPTWDELAADTTGKLNVAKVDCTSANGKPLCNQFEVRGYPTLLLFPTELVENGEGAQQKNYYKFQGPRSKDELISFSVGGDWVNAQSEEIPKSLEGFEYWQAWSQRTLKDIQRDIDMAVVQFKVDTYLPKPWRYLAVAGVFATPLILLCTLLCCCTEDYDDIEIPVKPKKVELAEKPDKAD